MARSLLSRFRGDLGQTLLAAWLIIYGLRIAVGLHFYGIDLVLGALAVVAGLLMLLGR